MAIKGKNITVLGAGIGGLTAAVALAQRGARVTVMDQSATLGEVGAGIQITPNGMAVMNALGLGSRLRKLGTSLEQVELRDYRTAKQIVSLDMRSTKRGGDAEYLLLHRADLIDVLAASAKRHGVAISLGKKVTGVAIGFDQAALPVENGPERTTKILIGADGLHSVTRRALNLDSEPSFTGFVAWRAMVNTAYVPLYDIPPVATVHVGPGRHLVTYPLRGGSLINVVAVCERETWVEEGWSHTDDPDNLRAAFTQFSPEVRRLLSLVDETAIWGLFSHPVAPSWCQSGTTILGDAAHAMLPFLAQGANMAIEDAWVLAAELEKHDDVHAGLSAYQAHRTKRVRRVVRASARNARAYHLKSKVMRAAFHAGIGLANRFANARLRRRFDWIYETDVTKVE